MKKNKIVKLRDLWRGIKITNNDIREARRELLKKRVKKWEKEQKEGKR